jgi:hypothetical protein
MGERSVRTRLRERVNEKIKQGINGALCLFEFLGVK